MEVVGIDIGVMRVDRVMVAEVELLGARSVDRGRSSSSPCGMGMVRSSGCKGQRSHVAYSRRGHQGELQRTHCLLNHIVTVTLTCHGLFSDLPLRHCISPTLFVLRTPSDPEYSWSMALCCRNRVSGTARSRLVRLTQFNSFHQSAPLAAVCGYKPAPDTWLAIFPHPCPHRNV